MSKSSILLISLLFLVLFAITTVITLIAYSPTFNRPLVRMWSSMGLGSPVVEAEALMGQGSFAAFRPNRTDRSGLIDPAGIFWDAEESLLWAVDRGNRRVLAFPITEENRPAAEAQIILGQADAYSSHVALFTDPWGVARREDLLAVSDRARGVVVLFQRRDDRWSHFGEFGQEWTADDGEPLSEPMGISFDRGTGWLWVADVGNDRVVGFEPPVTTRSVPAKEFALGLSRPMAVSARDGALAIADSGNGRVLVLDAPLDQDAMPLQIMPPWNHSEQDDLIYEVNIYFEPTAVTIDSVRRVWVADSGRGELLGFDAGKSEPFVVYPLAEGSNPEEGASPVGIARGPREWIWASDAAGHRLLSFRGDRQMVIGQSSVSDSGPNRIDEYGFHAPADVMIDPGTTMGIVWVADSMNHRVLGYAMTDLLGRDSMPMAIIGQSSNSAHAAGSGRRGLNVPTSLAVDASGGLYIADRENNRVVYFGRPLQSSPAATWLIGQPDWDSTAPNAGGEGAVSLNRPGGIAVDGNGDLYIADTDNHRILRVPGGAKGDGVVDRVWGRGESFSIGLPAMDDITTPSSLSFPMGIDLRSDGLMAIADSGNNRVLLFKIAGGMDDSVLVLGEDRDGQTAEGRRAQFMDSALERPTAVRFAGSGLYVTDSGNDRILFCEEVTADTASGVRVVAGHSGRLDAEADGASSSTLANPVGIAIDGRGRLFVADQDHHRVLIFLP